MTTGTGKTTRTTTRKRATTPRKTPTKATSKTATKTTRSPTAKTAPKPAAVVSLVEAAPAVAKAPESMMRKKDLVDRVVLASGMKKKDVKPVVEAALAELGKALAAGETLNLHPFGKLKVTRRKELPDGEALTARIRRTNRATGAETALAETDD